MVSLKTIPGILAYASFGQSILPSGHFIF